MNCLFIIAETQPAHRELFQTLRRDQVPFEVIHDAFGGIELVRNRHFDVIILDAKNEKMQVEQTIRLLKGCNPRIKVIVTTAENSKSLEARVRRENIYYFHLDSFGTRDLQLAILTACRQANGGFAPDPANDPTGH